MLATYRPSGRFSPFVFVLLPVVAAAVVGLAWVYEFVLRLIPFIYVDVAVTLGFGFVVAVVVSAALKLAKCRNVVVSAAVGMGAGTLAFCAGHYFGYVSDTGGQMPFWQYVQARVDTGWSIGHASSSGGAPFTGIVVWIVWVIEAAILVGAGFAGGANAAYKPFCEKCGFWADRDLRRFTISGPPVEAPGAIQSAGSVEALFPVEGPGTAARLADAELEYTVKGCHACDEFAALTVRLKRYEYDTRGNRSSKQTDLKSGVLLSREDLEALARAEERYASGEAEGAGGGTDQAGAAVSQQGS